MSPLAYFVLIIVIAVLIIDLVRRLRAATFVAASDSVGCEGSVCAINNRSTVPRQRYNHLNSWYVYGPQNPPFIGWLRHQIALSNEDAINSYYYDLQLTPI